ncbi:hypothetical protein Tco_1152059 [Tanacetum coccineum]
MPDTANISESEDTDSAHLPNIKPSPMNDLPKPENNWANALTKSYKDLEENKLLWKTGDMGSFISWFCKRIGKKKLIKSDLEGPTFKVAKAFHENSISLKTLPLGGPPGHVTIQSQFFFNKDLEYLVSGDKGRRLTLSISKLKEAQYLDFELEELVPSLWIKSEREYDISVAYGISYWWFKYKEFYIIRHSAPRILSVVSLKTYERYGYPFLKEIVLRIADYKEYKISKADFKNLHPNDFKDLYLLHLQEDLQLGVESYQTKLNLTQPDWDASDFLFKEDYTIVSKPRAIIYRDMNDQKKIMRETEVHKFSDGTLQRILEKLDHMVKDFKLVIRYDIKRSKSKNKGIVPTEMELELEQTQQGSSHEVSNIRVIPKYHSEDGNSARANIKQALAREHAEYDESNTYVLERFNTTAGNPVKEILLNLNLPDHRSILTDLKIHIKMVIEVPVSI